MIFRLIPTRCLALSIAFAAFALHAQQPVTVGKGSYASTPPLSRMVDGKTGIDRVYEVEKRPLFLVKDDGRPIPSNKWFQNLLFKEFGTGLWAMPHKVDATKEGIEIFLPNSFSGDGNRAIAESPLVITGKDFKPVDSRAKDWTDWTVSFRSFESDSRFMDVTLGEGMPAVWCEFAGVQPVIALGGNQGKGSRGKRAAGFFALDGSPATLPMTGDALGITHEGRAFGVFAPDGTKFAQTDAGIEVTFAGKSAFLVVCPMPSEKALALFHQHAFSVPRDTQLSWNYDRTAGSVTTSWKIITEKLKPNANGKVLQGFLPHHWRDNTSALKFDGPSYTTIRGALKCVAGDTFTLTRYAQAAFIAAQMTHPSYDVIIGKLRAAMENWFTFTPGEKEQFFAWYPRRKGLVGFPASYGSEHFTDTHFHQGYFVYAAGLLSQLQPDFAASHGDFARLLAKNYANYDRKDTRFPRFRTFDLWRGHSFADGNGFPDGNNQESTGEAVNSWAGMILLGEALGDAELTAAGVMGYTFETRANIEYWFDPRGDVFPKSYAHKACGMIWCNSIVWGTWFTASPAWIYGIQWLPSGPHMAFHDRDPNFITKVHADAMRELAAFEEKEAAKKPGSVKKAADIKSLGGELASYHLGFLMHADALRVVTELDAFWTELGDKVAHNEWTANLYWQASALAEIGRADFTTHSDSPTAMAYLTPATKTRTLVAWNPTAKPQTVQFYEEAKKIGRLEVPPHSIAKSIVK